MSCGSGLINTVINKLPFELHLPGYQYCGPGTKLKKRLARGDPGINKLDEACKEHDIAYSINKAIEIRHQADKKLQKLAIERIRSADARFGEKAASLLVAGVMKAKRSIGMGLRKTPKKCHPVQRTVIRKAKDAIRNLSKTKEKHHRHVLLKEGANLALAAAKVAVKNVGGKRNLSKPRIIPIPKTGGVLPLIPLFAGLSAIGSLVGGTAGVVKAVKDSALAKKKLEEATRHNQSMEAIALRNGKGLYLKPYKKGLGIFLGKTQKICKQQKN